MKKKGIVLIIILIILLMVIINKFFVYNKYSSKQDINIYNEGNVTIMHKEAKKYLIHNGLKLRDDFSKYEYENSDDAYVLYDKDEDIINMFAVYKTETLLNIFKYYGDILSESYIEQFLKDNNINNDIDLLDYISNYSKDVRFLNSNKEIKLNYYIRNYINDVLPLVDEYKVIDGDYSGILVYNYNHEEEQTIEIMLLYKDVRYILSFIGSDIYEKDILDLVGTVIFDEEE